MKIDQEIGSLINDLARLCPNVEDRLAEIEFARKRIHPLAFVSHKKFLQYEQQGAIDQDCSRCDDPVAACLGLKDHNTTMTVYVKVEDVVGVPLRELLENKNYGRNSQTENETAPKSL